MRFSKLLIATVGAAVLVGALVGAAAAARLSSSSQTFRTAFNTPHFQGVFGEITCRLTLEGSLHSRTVTKNTETLRGFITAANIGACTEGSTTILRETLPWHVKYRGFTGTLPNITSMAFDIIGYSFRIREPIVACLARSEAASPLVMTFTRSAATRELTGAEVSGAIPTDCGFEGTFNSDNPVPTVLGAATRITVTLI